MHLMSVTPVAPGAETSLARLVERLQSRGYTCQYEIAADGTVSCPGCGKSGPTTDLKVDAFRRFEGPSDPDEEAIVCAVRWKDEPNCRGVLVLGFGPTSSSEHRIALSNLSFEDTDSGEHAPCA